MGASEVVEKPLSTAFVSHAHGSSPILGPQISTREWRPNTTSSCRSKAVLTTRQLGGRAQFQESPPFHPHPQTTAFLHLMAAPGIRISTSPSCSLHSATDHSKQERSGKGDALPRSSTPSASSARGSTTSPQGSLTLPSIYHRRGSSTSIPSTVTLTDNFEAPCSTVFGGELTADPESEIATPDEATNDAHNDSKLPEDEVEVYLAPVPVRHVKNHRYHERESLDK